MEPEKTSNFLLLDICQVFLCVWIDTSSGISSMVSGKTSTYMLLDICQTLFRVWIDTSSSIRSMVSGKTSASSVSG